MDKLKNLISNLKKIKVESIAKPIIDSKKDIVVQLNKDEMMKGKQNDNNDMRPYYTEDPYFKTKQAALRYAAWKKRITPNQFRKTDSPNLFINGKFHSSLYFQAASKHFTIKTNSALGAKVTSKFKDALGLNIDAIKRLSIIIKDEVVKKYKSKILEL
jgi:hypothetical protein